MDEDKKTDLEEHEELLCSFDPANIIERGEIENGLQTVLVFCDAHDDVCETVERVSKDPCRHEKA